MKKVYYLCHCGSGTSVHCKLLDLHKQEGNKLLFHIEDWDYNKCKTRTITLKAYIRTRLNYKGEPYEYIDFNSSKPEYKYDFIRVREINDNETPQKTICEV